MKRRLIERSLEDDAFRQRLLEDPKGAVEQELGTPVPEEVQVRVVEETPDTIYLVLPPSASPLGQGDELSDGNSRRWPAATPGTSRPLPMGSTEIVAHDSESRSWRQRLDQHPDMDLRGRPLLPPRRRARVVMGMAAAYPLPGGGHRATLALAPFGVRTRRRAKRKGRGTMSEAAAGGGRAEAERRIIQRSLQDDAFRQQLLADPKAAVEQELGARLPEEVRVVAVEESPDTVYLVLPSTPMAGREGGALSDQELEMVAGGQPAEMTTETTCAAQCGTLDC
jgi:hypothetical protein